MTISTELTIKFSKAHLSNMVSNRKRVRKKRSIRLKCMKKRALHRETKKILFDFTVV